jgi:hypothetical protein
MSFLMFAPHYLWWHYTKAIQELFKNIKVLLTFIIHFFSISILLSTVFDPLKVGGDKALPDKASWSEVVFVNTMLRVAGFFVRSATILLGIFTLCWSAVFSVVVILAWLLAPILWFLLLVLVVETVI